MECPCLSLGETGCSARSVGGTGGDNTTQRAVRHGPERAVDSGTAAGVRGQLVDRLRLPTTCPPPPWRTASAVHHSRLENRYAVSHTAHSPDDDEKGLFLFLERPGSKLRVLMFHMTRLGQRALLRTQKSLHSQ